MTLIYGFQGTILATVLQYVAYCFVLFPAMKEAFHFSLGQLATRLLQSIAIIGALNLLAYSFIQPIQSRILFLLLLVSLHFFMVFLFYVIYRKLIVQLRAVMAKKASALGKA